MPCSRTIWSWNACPVRASRKSASLPCFARQNGTPPGPNCGRTVPERRRGRAGHRAEAVPAHEKNGERDERGGGDEQQRSGHWAEGKARHSVRTRRKPGLGQLFKRQLNSLSFQNRSAGQEHPCAGQDPTLVVVVDGVRDKRVYTEFESRPRSFKAYYRPSTAPASVQHHTGSHHRSEPWRLPTIYYVPTPVPASGHSPAKSVLYLHILALFSSRVHLGQHRASTVVHLRYRILALLLHVYRLQ